MVSKLQIFVVHNSPIRSHLVSPENRLNGRFKHVFNETIRSAKGSWLTRAVVFNLSSAEPMSHVILYKKLFLKILNKSLIPWLYFDSIAISNSLINNRKDLSRNLSHVCYSLSLKLLQDWFHNFRSLKIL